MRLPDYGIAPSLPADIVVPDAITAAEAVATLAPPLFGLKAGRRTFERPAPRLLRNGRPSTPSPAVTASSGLP